MSKKFHVGDVLSITTSRLVSREGIDGVYKILNYMSGENLMTHQLPRISRECRPLLLEQYPELVDVDASAVNENNLNEWLNEQIKKYGEMLTVNQLSGNYHKYVHPFDEDIIKEKALLLYVDSLNDGVEEK